MNDDNQREKDKDKKKDEFLYPKRSYRGEFTPENLVIDSNLQEFAQKISFICNLETSGKITPQEAYLKIKALWKELKKSAKNLGIDKQK